MGKKKPTEKIKADNIVKNSNHPPSSDTQTSKVTKLPSNQPTKSSGDEINSISKKDKRNRLVSANVWPSYDNVEKEKETEDLQYEQAGNFSLLAMRAISSDHFQFKHEKEWESQKAIEFSKYFSIDSDSLARELSTVSFCDRYKTLVKLHDFEVEETNNFNSTEQTAIQNKIESILRNNVDNVPEYERNIECKDQRKEANGESHSRDSIDCLTEDLLDTPSKSMVKAPNSKQLELVSEISTISDLNLNDLAIDSKSDEKLQNESSKNPKINAVLESIGMLPEKNENLEEWLDGILDD